MGDFEGDMAMCVCVCVCVCVSRTKSMVDEAAV